MSKVQYTDSNNVDADLIRFIEGGNECEQMAAIWNGQSTSR